MPTNVITADFFWRFASCLFFIAIGVVIIIYLYRRSEFPRDSRLMWGFLFIGLAVINVLTLEQLARNIETWFKITPLEFNYSLTVVPSNCPTSPTLP